MSRIGKKIIALPKGVTAEIKEGQITVKGPKGTLSTAVPEGITPKIENNEITFARSSDQAKIRALHGLARALTNNMVVGVSEGFTKKLEMVGVGYKAEKKNNWIQFSLGFSHPVIFAAPKEIAIDITSPTTLTVSGIDKQLVGAVAAKIRSIRPPEPYKGKGVKYSDEKIIRKAGKTAGK
ncbi:MAG TPA: 50S ribosomal protein L6 [Candidatus Kapabacteria bacterium]|nr:50S ribosomal protein L6 [Candidatus Kapabacteria bacterium]